MKKLISIFLSFVMLLSAFSCVGINAYAATSTTVKFEQSNARTVLNMINSFRSSGDTWYWNSNNTAKTYVTCSPLQYDYTLEKIAMQRACELVYLMSTKGLTAQAYLPLTAITAILQTAKAKILLKLLIKVKIQLIMPLLFTTLGVKTMNIMPVRVTDVQCLTLVIPQ